jgi:hypothetical protein
MLWTWGFSLAFKKDILSGHWTLSSCMEGRTQKIATYCLVGAHILESKMALKLEISDRA